jgi:hypothetical protein
MTETTFPRRPRLLAPNGAYLEAALAADAAGLCVVPPREDGSKAPVGEWKVYQERRSTDDEILTWYANGRSGLGLICGRISGGLEMLEIEGRGVAEGVDRQFRDLCEAAGLGGLLTRILAGYSERTPKGGYHLLYRVDTVLGNTELARRSATAAELADRPDDPLKVLLETRGEGGFVIVAPSNGKVHPDGGAWELIAGGFASIAHITDDERDQLWRVAKALDQVPPPPPRPRQRTGEDRPGDRYDAAPDVQERTIDLLKRHGWTLVYEKGDRAFLRRPGKDMGISATVGFAGPGVLHVFSTSVPQFESKRSIAPFSVFAKLEHDDDFSAAAKSLEPPPTFKTGRSVPAASGDVAANSRKRVRFRTARQIANELPATVPWAVRTYLAFGTITELDGRAKSAGKTTWALALVRAILSGASFLNQPTSAGPVVLLTEQNNASLRDALARAHLLERDDLSILTWSDAIGMPWAVAVEAAGEEAQRIGARVLIVDTLPQWAGLRGDTENDAGAALEAIEPLQQLAADGLAVLIVRHDRKGSGPVGESGRGSSAFTGAVDIVLALNRDPNDLRPTMRRLLALSRLTDAPPDLMLELVDGEYRVLGEIDAVKATALRELVFSLLPADGEEPIAPAALVDAADRDEATLKQALKGMLAESPPAVTRHGQGRKGDPYRWTKAGPNARFLSGAALTGTAPSERKPPGRPDDDAPRFDELAAVAQRQVFRTPNESEAELLAQVDGGAT